MKPRSETGQAVKILFVIDSLVCGGKERQLTELVRGLVRTGEMAQAEVAVMSMHPEGHFDRAIEETGVRLFKLSRHWRWDPFFTSRVRAVIRELRPRVICSFNPMSTFYAAVAKLGLRVALVDASIRDVFPLATLGSELLSKFNFWAADLVVANSKAGLLAKGAPATKSRVLYNGFDIARLADLPQPRAIREVLGMQTPQAVGMVACFSKVKDWETFFQAARIVLTKRRDVTFVAVGGGDLLETYKERFGGQPGILFTGWQTRVEAILGALDVGVLCSVVEGIPNAVIEYMAAALPVVVTAGGGIAELVVDGETGFRVHHGNPHLLAERILYLLENRHIARRMGEKGRTRIRQDFSLEKAVRRLTEICQEAVGKDLEFSSRRVEFPG